MKGNTEPVTVFATLSFSGYYGFSSDAPDWNNNHLNDNGKPAPQYAEAISAARTIWAATGGHVTFMGHSLGGGLAAAQALITGGYAYSFEGPVPAAANIENRTDLLNDAYFDAHVTRYYANNGVVSEFVHEDEPTSSVGRIVGNPIRVPVSGSDDPLVLHQPNYMVQGLLESLLHTPNTSYHVKGWRR